MYRILDKNKYDNNKIDPTSFVPEIKQDAKDVINGQEQTLIPPPALVITTQSLNKGYIGLPYSQTLAAEGGYGSYAWSLVGDNNPSWMSINPSTGVISGTAPAPEGTFNVTVQVQDTPPANIQQQVTTKTFKITVENQVIPHTVSTPSVPSGPTTGHPTISYTYSSGGSTCSAQHGVEYRFDWGDGNFSGWSSSTSASHSWASAGTYNVKAQARCSADNAIISSWSTELAVTISSYKFTVAYIYQTDTTSANSFKNFLDGLGYPTSLIQMNSITYGMFASYGLILIGSDTGNLDTWGDSGKVAAINDSGKQIVGLGEGGYAFFGKLSLRIGYPEGAHDSYLLERKMYIMDPSSSIYTTPNNITIPPDQIIPIYNSAADVELYLPDLNLDGIAVIGKDAVYSNYSPLLQENSQYLLWGWTTSPDSMTQIGKYLFENAIVWCSIQFIDTWSRPGDLAEWGPNTDHNTVTVVDTGGNPSGYLSSQNDVSYPYAGVRTKKAQITKGFSSSSSIQFSFDSNIFSGLNYLQKIYIRLRYHDSSYNGWYHYLSNPAQMNVWNTYSVTFDPNWTDAQAIAAGWASDGPGTPSFQQTMSDVYTVEVRFTGYGVMSVGIDNFARRK
jgi:hypothetical protein